MSWNVMIFNTRGRKPPPIEEFQESDFEPVGTFASVRQQLDRLLPGIDWSDPTWGIYRGDGFSISFNVGPEDPIDTIGLRIVGGGDALAAIVAFARPLGWSALDYSTGQFLDLEDPSRAGWEGFQAYRDRVI